MEQGIAYYFRPAMTLNPTDPTALRMQLEKATSIEISSFDVHFKSIGICAAPLRGNEFTCEDESGRHPK
jgi:hypothetical protein